MSNESEARGNPGTAVSPRMCRVIADYHASYPDPISVHAGESIDISENLDYWNGNPNWVWIWCTDQRGNSGWVPADHVTES